MAVTAVGALSCCSISLMHAVSVRRRHGIEIRPRRRPGPIAVDREIRSIHGAPHEHRDKDPSDCLDAAGSVTLSIRACVLHEWAACGNRQGARPQCRFGFQPFLAVPDRNGTNEPNIAPGGPRSAAAPAF